MNRRTVIGAAAAWMPNPSLLARHTQDPSMSRRAFLVFAALFVAAPATAVAQAQTVVRRIGILDTGAPLTPEEITAGPCVSLDGSKGGICTSIGVMGTNGRIVAGSCRRTGARQGRSHRDRLPAPTAAPTNQVNHGVSRLIHDTAVRKTRCWTLSGVDGGGPVRYVAVRRQTPYRSASTLQRFALTWETTA